MYCSDNEDSSCSETRRRQCDTKKRLCEGKKNPYDVAKKKPLCDTKKKPAAAAGESKFESWKEMYKENKFTMDTILCVACFGSAIIFSRYINPDFLKK